MGKKKLINNTSSDLFISLFVRDGNDIETDSSTENITVKSKKNTMANYGDQPFLNAISVSCYDMNDGDMNNLSDVALKIGSDTDTSLNTYDTITFVDSNNNLELSYSNTWTV